MVEESDGKRRVMLDYRRPNAVDKKRRRLSSPVRTVVFYGGIGLFISICLLPISLVIGGIGIGVTVVGCLIGSLILDYQSMRSWKDLTEEEVDAEWEGRQREKEEMIAEAKRVYAGGPLGIWRWTRLMHVVKGAYEVSEHGWISFGVNAAGEFGWERPMERVLVKTEFRFRMVEAGMMEVRFVHPEVEGWHRVEFGFDVMMRNEERELMIWFEGENPLGEELGMHWPFGDDFLRMAK